MSIKLKPIFFIIFLIVLNIAYAPAAIVFDHHLQFTSYSDYEPIISAILFVWGLILLVMSIVLSIACFVIGLEA